MKVCHNVYTKPQKTKLSEGNGVGVFGLVLASSGCSPDLLAVEALLLIPAGECPDAFSLLSTGRFCYTPSEVRLVWHGWTLFLNEALILKLALCFW